MTKIKCEICGKEFKHITHTHLKKHNLTTKEYRQLFPSASFGVSPFYGKQHTKESKKKMSENNAMKNPENRKKVSKALTGRDAYWIRGKPLTTEHRRKIGESQKGKILSEEHKRKISENKERAEKISKAKTGKSRPDMQGENSKMKLPEVRRKVSETRKKLYQEHPEIKLIGNKNPMNKPENREKQLQATRTDEFRNTARERTKKNWQDPEYVLKVLKGENQKPTKPEKDIISILNIILPNEYIYNGKFNKKNITLIGGKLPDFVNINGKKKLIELNGCYFHNCPICYPNGGRDNTINGFKDSQERIDYFKKYGWDTLIIWEHELKNKNTVINKILQFHNLPYKLGTKQLTID